MASHLGEGLGQLGQQLLLRLLLAKHGGHGLAQVANLRGAMMLHAFSSEVRA